jgi:VWFA-related protein
MADFIRLAACLVLIHGAFAQEAAAPTPNSETKFTVRTELVIVPVIVLRHGEHAEGLKPADFTIKEDGVSKPIASFEEIRSAASSILIPIVPSATERRGTSAVGPLTGTVLLIDLLNTPYPSQEFAMRKLVEFLGHEFGADSPAMLAAMNGSRLQILHDFTTDREALIRLVQQVYSKSRPALENNQPLQGPPIKQEIDVTNDYYAISRQLDIEAKGSSYRGAVVNPRIALTLLQLLQLARHLETVPGMKNVVWATSGFAMPKSMEKDAPEIWALYKLTFQRLGAARVSVFPVDVTDATQNPTYSPPEFQNSVPVVRTIVDAVGPVQTFMDIARRTGGDYCVLHKDPNLCFRRAVDYGSKYYVLTYYAGPSDRLQWRKLDVSVRGPGLHVRARSGYFSAGPNSAADAVPQQH